MGILLKNLVNFWHGSQQFNIINTNFLSLFIKKNYSSKFIPFKDEINKRRIQAKNSIVVQVQSQNSFKDLYNYCSEFGTVSKMFHYTNSSQVLHFILVEFNHKEAMQKVLSHGKYMNDDHLIPVYSQFLWFRATSSSKMKKNRSDFQLSCQDGNNIPTSLEIENSLLSSNTISDQMINLYNLTKLNDLGTRLRYITANQIEVAMSNIFPYVIALPFGSSVNTFGKLGCDLDLILNFNNQHDTSIEDQRLMFHMKSGFGDERMQYQRFLEGIGDILQIFLPGCTNIRKILHARVPILKYTHSYTNLECDISIKNLSGIVMSELLYIFSQFSPCVKPLVFTIRKWAREVGLTNSSPGRWLTNFSITLLVISFLQRTKPTPILPTINQILKDLDSKEKFFQSDDLTHGRTILNKLTKLPKLKENPKTMEMLLIDFFEYFSTFEFDKYAVSLYSGNKITKPDYSPLYIINPLELNLNVSKNVSIKEVEKFTYQCRNALWILDSKTDSQVFGLLKLFHNGNSDRQKLFSMSKPQNRLMEVTNIFEDDEQFTLENATQNQANDIK